MSLMQWQKLIATITPKAVSTRSARVPVSVEATKVRTTGKPPWMHAVSSMLGRAFEAEIGEQPTVWERIAGNGAAAALARATDVASVIFVGSGSSLFVALFVALAYRRAGVAAVALAASEAAFDARTHTGATVVAISQSGRSADVLSACDALAPARLVALTNDVSAPLAQRAAQVVDMGCGPERAIPASKSVSASLALVRLAAAALGGERDLVPALRAAASDAQRFLTAPGDIAAVAARLAERTVEVVGAGYGVMLANEIALKLKEAAYVQAEGFSAGESAMAARRCSSVPVR